MKYYPDANVHMSDATHRVLPRLKKCSIWQPRVRVLLPNDIRGRWVEPRFN